MPINTPQHRFVEAPAMPMQPLTTITVRDGYRTREVKAAPVPGTSWYVLCEPERMFRDEGVYVHAAYTATGEKSAFSARVTPLRVSTWSDNVRLSAVNLSTGMGNVDPAEAKASAVLLANASNHATMLNADADKARERAREAEHQRRVEAERARQERQAKEEERRAERAKEYEAWNSWNDAMQEALQWNVGERLRLIRWGKKATVFGTLDNVSTPDKPDYSGQRNGYIELTTEKGKHMQLYFGELERLELKDPDYRTVYNELDLPVNPRRKNQWDGRREIAGGKAKPVPVTVDDGLGDE